MNPPQHMAALDHANTVRLARADIKRHVRMSSREVGARLVSEVLLAPPSPACEKWEVFDLLLRIKYVGRHHALNMLLSAGVSESKAIGALTPRQRKELADTVVRCCCG